MAKPPVERRYYLPRSLYAPSPQLNLLWTMWATSRLIAIPGWAWGVFWTLYAIVVAGWLMALWQRTPYSADHVDRVLGRPEVDRG